MRRVLIPIFVVVLCGFILGGCGYLSPTTSKDPDTPTPVIILPPEPTANPRPTATQSQPPATVSAIPPVGEQAPDFTLSSVSGDTVTLSRYEGQKNIVLVFYRTGG